MPTSSSDSDSSDAGVPIGRDHLNDWELPYDDFEAIRIEGAHIGGARIGEARTRGASHRGGRGGAGRGRARTFLTDGGRGAGRVGRRGEGVHPTHNPRPTAADLVPRDFGARGADGVSDARRDQRFGVDDYDETFEIYSPYSPYGRYERDHSPLRGQGRDDYGINRNERFGDIGANDLSAHSSYPTVGRNYDGRDPPRIGNEEISPLRSLQMRLFGAEDPFSDRRRDTPSYRGISDGYRRNGGRYGGRGTGLFGRRDESPLRNRRSFSPGLYDAERDDDEYLQNPRSYYSPPRRDYGSYAGELGSIGNRNDELETSRREANDRERRYDDYSRSPYGHGARRDDELERRVEHHNTMRQEGGVCPTCGRGGSRPDDLGALSRYGALGRNTTSQQDSAGRLNQSDSFGGARRFAPEARYGERRYEGRFNTNSFRDSDVPEFFRRARAAANGGGITGKISRPSSDFKKSITVENPLAIEDTKKVAERPEQPPVRTESVGTEIELFTNHVLVHLPKKSIKMYVYAVQLYNKDQFITNPDEGTTMFAKLARAHRGEFHSKHCIFNGKDIVYTTERLNVEFGFIRYQDLFMEVKFIKEINFSEEHLSEDIAALATTIATFNHRIQNISQIIFLNNFMYLINTIEPNIVEILDHPVTIPLKMGVDSRLGISIDVTSNLEVGFTARLNATHTMFTRPLHPTVLIFCEILNDGPITRREFEEKWDSRLKTFIPPGNTIQNRISGVLKNMRLSYSIGRRVRDSSSIFDDHHIGTEFEFYQFTDTSANRAFVTGRDGRRVSMSDHYFQSHHIRLRYPNLPCFIRKPSDPTENLADLMYPMEFVRYAGEPRKYEGDRVQGLNGEFSFFNRTEAPQRLALLQQVARQHQIADVPALIDNTEYHMRESGLKFEKELLTVKATVLPAPTVVYGGGSTFKDDNHEGIWKAVNETPIRKVLEGSELVRNADKDATRVTKMLIGSILEIGLPAKNYNVEHFHQIMRAISRTGQPVVWADRTGGKAKIQGVHAHDGNPENIEKFFRKLKAEVKEINKVNKEEKLIPIVIVIIGGSKKEQEESNDYNIIKYLSENKVGIHTQAILLKNFEEIKSDPSICRITASLTEKILAKVGTTHRKLERGGDHVAWTKFTDPTEPTLVLSIDISFPTMENRGERRNEWSVASVVGNIDLDCADFRSSSKIESYRVESFIDIKRLIKKRINEFIKNTSIRPAHIVVYRDGLAEKDFKRVLHLERMLIDECCIGIEKTYTPTITYIAVDRKSKTQFFLKNSLLNHSEIGSHPINPSPGTLVEHGVTTKDCNDFFLISQSECDGVVRPIHYYVLHDTWTPSTGFWPTITFALCYLSCKDTRTTALPAPVIYAGLANKRAKEILEGSECYGRITHRPLEDRHLQQVVKTHEDLDGMLFV